MNTEHVQFSSPYSIYVTEMGSRTAVVVMLREWEVTVTLGCYYWNRTTSVPKSVPRG